MEEKALTAKKSGFSMLPLCFIVFASGAALFVYAIGHLERGENALGGFLLVVAILGYIAGIIALPGFKVLKPQEALVLTLFGHYAGTLREQMCIRDSSTSPVRTSAAGSASSPPRRI